MDPTILICLFSAFFGSVVGSFLNVCIYRLPRECQSIRRPLRSRCPRCLTPIAWYDNVPLVSFAMLGAKCRHCRARISWQYPVVEALSAALFAAVAYWALAGHPRPEAVLTQNERLGLLLAGWYLIGVLVITTFIDFKYRIIPDEITYTGMALAPLASAFLPLLHWPLPTEEILSSLPLRGLVSSLVGQIVGGGIVYAARVLGEAAFGREAMGLGDVKFMCVVGGFLGPAAVLTVFFVGCMLGAVFGSIRYLVVRDRYMAFGPFLSMGALVVLFFQSDIYRFVLERVFLNPARW